MGCFASLMYVVQGNGKELNDMALSSLVDSTDWPLEIWPDHGSMLGGDIIYFTGPCLLPSNPKEYRCYFGEDLEQEGQLAVPADGEAMPVGKCVVPRLDTLGQVTFRVEGEGEEPDQLQIWSRKYHASEYSQPDLIQCNTLQLSSCINAK